MEAMMFLTEKETSLSTDNYLQWKTDKIFAIKRGRGNYNHIIGKYKIEETI